MFLLLVLVDFGHVSNQNVLILEHFGADITLKRLGVTDAVNGGQVLLQVSFIDHLLAANLTLEPRFGAFTLTVRRTVVSIDR